MTLAEKNLVNKMLNVLMLISVAQRVHWGRVMQICIGKLASLVQIMVCHVDGASHYLNQWWNIKNWALGNTFQWNRNRNLCIFIQENVVWEMSAILSRPQCVNKGASFVTGVNTMDINLPMSKSFLQRKQQFGWLNELTYSSLVMPCGKIELGQHWLR